MTFENSWMSVCICTFEKGWEKKKERVSELKSGRVKDTREEKNNEKNNIKCSLMHGHMVCIHLYVKRTHFVWLTIR